jgi:hypothetical protein
MTAPAAVRESAGRFRDRMDRGPHRCAGQARDSQRAAPERDASTTRTARASPSRTRRAR